MVTGHSRKLSVKHCGRQETCLALTWEPKFVVPGSRAVASNSIKAKPTTNQNPRAFSNYVYIRHFDTGRFAYDDGSESAGSDVKFTGPVIVVHSCICPPARGQWLTTFKSFIINPRLKLCETVATIQGRYSGLYIATGPEVLLLSTSVSSSHDS